MRRHANGEAIVYESAGESQLNAGYLLPSQIVFDMRWESCIGCCTRASGAPNRVEWPEPIMYAKLSVRHTSTGVKGVLLTCGPSPEV